MDPSDHRSGRQSFRDRLAQIPDLEPEEADANDDWEHAAPPVVQRSAPIARPRQAEPEPLQREPDYDQNVQSDTDYEEYEPIGQPRRRRWPFVVGLLLLIIALLVVIPVFLARRTFDSIERVPVAEALSVPVPEGRNILLVGTDSRDGIDSDTENAGVILGEGISGERTDTIMILRLEEDGSKFLSLPRDLWLPINGGAEQRINTAFGQGPEALINTVRNELGIPISHYVQVDLAGFIDLVDAVGGVDITIENPAFDTRSGLDLPTAGTVTLDSNQALAWVRSRTYTEIIDGQNRVDLTSDLGRVARQQVFMRALMDKVLAQRNPVVLNEMAAAMAAAVELDDATSLTEAVSIANTLRQGTPESVVLPTTPDTRSGNSVLILTPEADEVLRQFGGS